MRKEAKHYTGEEKVSNLCDELGLQPTVFYRRQKEFFENGAAAFQGKSRPDKQAEQQRIAFLGKKIQRKDEVLAELMAEHIALKKKPWGALTKVCVRHWSEKTAIGTGRFIGSKLQGRWFLIF